MIPSTQITITYLNDLNTKHNSIKFDYKISQSIIPFLTQKFRSKTKHYTQDL